MSSSILPFSFETVYLSFLFLLDCFSESDLETEIDDYDSITHCIVLVKRPLELSPAGSGNFLSLKYIVFVRFLKFLAPKEGED